MKTDTIKNLVLDTLKEMPIVQFACKKAGIGRTTYYRWLEDKEFAKNTDAAIAEGEAFMTDMTESQLISLIRNGNYQAVQLWLRHHHPKYSTKIELTGNLRFDDEPLSPEQQELLEKALKLAGLQSEESESQNQNEQDKTSK